MKFSSFAVALAALFALSTGCKDSLQPEPPIVEPPVVAPPVAPPPTPPGARPGGTYRSPSSRYILYEDSTFALQYSHIARPYTGRYSIADSLITLDFDAKAGQWQATGTLRGDSLTVKYNTDMMLSDFEDGVYVLEDGVYVESPIAEDIYLANTDGSGVTRLTRGGWPAWSPDGSKIAFHRSGNVYVVHADGSHERRLVPGGFAAWSPDGTQIVFISAEGISVMNVGGSGSVRTLIRHEFRDDTYADDMGVGKPAWSPDGKRIAFEHLGDGDMTPAQVYVMNADGSAPRLLTTSSDRRRYAESDPSWSPDGSSIVLWSYGYGIATVDANGGVPNSIYMNFPTIAYGAKPNWSLGRSIAFNTFRGSSGESAIWIVPAIGGGAKLLVPDAYYAAWSQDGARLAFVSRRVE
jgi:TolB protein